MIPRKALLLKAGTLNKHTSATWVVGVNRDHLEPSSQVVHRHNIYICYRFRPRILRNLDVEHLETRIIFSMNRCSTKTVTGSFREISTILRKAIISICALHSCKCKKENVSSPIEQLVARSLSHDRGQMVFCDDELRIKNLLQGQLI